MGVLGDDIERRTHAAVESLVGRAVSGNEKLGGGLGFSSTSLPSLIQHVARALNDPPTLHQGGLPLPPNVAAFLGITLGTFKDWVRAQVLTS